MDHPVEGSPGDREVRRVLIVSADMGEGHNATGRALAEAVRHLWPRCTVDWLDTLDVMGRGVGPVFRGIYVTNVRHTPWLYEFFYAALGRMRWFAAASKRFVGAWSGRRLAPHIARLNPDLILSTYPLGSAGLAWLRQHRSLDVPVGAWVSDFAPHPFWVHQGLDRHYVMHDVAVRHALRCAPGAAVKVAAPPVTRAFSPGDRVAARGALDLPLDALVALVSCGSLGFGAVEAAVAELLEVSPDVLPVVVCGHNTVLRTRIEALGGDRVRALGWTDAMPALTVAADVVVTNAGGATSLEALACGRPVLMYRPIAAHGRANAALMAEAGLAQICGPGELRTTMARLMDHPETLAAMEKAATDHSSGRTVTRDIAELSTVSVRGRSSRHRPERLRAADAMFVHAQTPEVPQQTGAVLVFERKPDGASLTTEEAAGLLVAAPRAQGRLLRGSAWHRPAWQPDPAVTITVDEVNTDDLISAMDDFFSCGIADDQLCRGRLVHELAGTRSALMFKLHHALGDGMVVIWSLVGRLHGETFIRSQPEAQQPAPLRKSLRSAIARGHLLAGGLWRLARAGTAPKSALNSKASSVKRHHAIARFPAARISTAAKSFGVSKTDFLLTLLAEAVHRTTDQGDRIRAIVTRSTRNKQTFRMAGNHTGAASVDLPTAAMPLAERARRSRTALRSQVNSGAAETAALVLRLIGVAPPWLHAWLVRRIYNSTWFNMITSMLPGESAPLALHGAELSVVYPVLALAPGVGISVGLMSWRDDITISISVTPDLAATADDLIAAIHATLDEVAPE